MFKNKPTATEYTGDTIKIEVDPDIDPGFERAVDQEMAKAYVVNELEAKAAIYAERNKLYGNNYKRFGPILALILDTQDLDPRDPKQMNRLGVFVQIVAKMTRYGENFTRGGHNDSLDDIAVYSMMLKELDNE